MPLEFEDILAQVGHFGKYQRNLMLMFLFPSATLLPWFAMNNLFIVTVPDHWCNVPELDSWNLTVHQRQMLIRPPEDPRCTRYDINYTNLLNRDYGSIVADGNWTVEKDAKIMSCDNGWQYDKTYHEDTAATQWNMVCDKQHQASLILTLANVGSVIGTPFYGALSDRIGRRPTFFIVVTVTCLSAISSFFMTNFTAFLVLRGINGGLMPSIFQLPYIILLEIVGPEMRTRMNGIGNSSWTLGLCILPLVAWLCREWITFGLITSSVTLLFFLYWLILPESPRWLLSRERYVEAAKILSKIGDANGKPQDPADLLIQLQKIGERIKKEKKLSSEDDLSKSFTKYPVLRRRFLIITVCWMANVLSYYGLQINVPNLGGNEFVNFFLLALVEMPAIVCSWFVMQRVGRRPCAVASLTIAGVACLVPIFYEEAATIASLVGKFGSMAAFMTVYQQSSELYPTNLRALGMGLSGTMAGLANISVPYLVFLSIHGKYIPFVILSTVCLAAAIFASFLPETLHKNLPQTVNDAEKFGVNQKYFSLNWDARRPLNSEECEPQLLDNARLEMVRC